MICNVISTGSKGNCVILDDAIMIDIGVPFKKIEPYIKNIKLVLLTHAHMDHINPATVRKLHNERPGIRFGCCWWMVQHLVSAGIPFTNIDVYDANSFYQYLPDIYVSPFLLSHDVENCGYKIRLGDEWALYATDTGTMAGIEAKDFDLYMIEANHTEAEIAERIQRKLDAGEFVYEYRAAQGHLSKEKADAWLAENATPGKSRVIYLHQHEERTEK